MAINNHGCGDLNNQKEIVLGAIESLEQAKTLVESVTQAQYTKTCKPYVQSTIGDHMRHMLDMYQALRDGLKQKDAVVDYDLRRRGSAIETSKEAARDDIDSHIQWFKHTFYSDEQGTLNSDALVKPLQVKTEVLLSRTACATVSSNLGREIIFVASHAVHHFAILMVIGKLQNVAISDSFGVAPATRTFLRDESTDSAKVCAR